MQKQIGLWIDHKEALIVILNGDSKSVQRIESKVGIHAHYHGATHPRSPFSAQYQQGDDQLDRKFIERLNKFYGNVIAQMWEADILYLFGPGEAKYEFEKRLLHENPRIKIAAIETTDKLTERQIIAKVEKFFEQLPA